MADANTTLISIIENRMWQLRAPLVQKGLTALSNIFRF